jgi:AcrR family transcriptional regulator
MRVTAETRSATRERILEVARKLFAAQGFEAATTRDIAQGAQIAAGTLFNYFPSKEAVVTCLAAEALEQSYRQFEAHATEELPFQEQLFNLVVTGLRKLKPFRTYLPVVLESTLSPLACTGEATGQSLRGAHLELVNRLASQHGYGYEGLSAVALQIYWSLFTGLLQFWANDRSPRQEDTLALLDHSVEMFAGWLEGRPDELTSKPEK